MTPTEMRAKATMLHDEANVLEHDAWRIENAGMVECGRAFLAALPELLNSHPGHHVVVHEGKVLVPHDSLQGALAEFYGLVGSPASRELQRTIVCEIKDCERDEDGFEITRG